MTTGNDSENKLSKVLWRCKRGMLELDLMLQNFCEQAYVSLAPEKQDLFEELLQEQDTDLQSWLVTGVPATNAKFQDMILVIRHLHTMRTRAAQQQA
jgi:antitoxin CptB